MVNDRLMRLYNKAETPNNPIIFFFDDWNIKELFLFPIFTQVIIKWQIFK